MTRPALDDAPHPWLDFFLTSLNIAMVHANRELKYRARIRIPSGYSLVGVADVHMELEEGQVYSRSLIRW
jgi:RNA-dependent RNA polymerase